MDDDKITPLTQVDPHLTDGSALTAMRGTRGDGISLMNQLRHSDITSKDKPVDFDAINRNWIRVIKPVIHNSTLRGSSDLVSAADSLLSWANTCDWQNGQLRDPAVNSETYSRVMKTKISVNSLKTEIASLKNSHGVYYLLDELENFLHRLELSLFSGSRVSADGSIQITIPRSTATQPVNDAFGYPSSEEYLAVYPDKASLVKRFARMRQSEE